jgi:hypothetical protein
LQQPQAVTIKTHQIKLFQLSNNNTAHQHAHNHLIIIIMPGALTHTLDFHNALAPQTVATRVLIDSQHNEASSHDDEEFLIVAINSFSCHLHFRLQFQCTLMK